VNLEQSDRNPISSGLFKRRAGIELRHVLPSPSGSDPTAEFIEAVCTLASLVVALPVFLVMSMALALAIYVRCAGVLLRIG
jgi:hypothetical protein